MHTKDARAGGESEQRLYGLAAWEEAPYYSDAERAAIALTEAVTLCADGHVADAVWAEAAGQFNDAELAALVALLVAINGWNRIGASTRTWLPGSYEP